MKVETHTGTTGPWVEAYDANGGRRWSVSRFSHGLWIVTIHGLYLDDENRSTMGVSFQCDHDGEILDVVDELYGAEWRARIYGAMERVYLVSLRLCECGSVIDGADSPRCVRCALASSVEAAS